ncbi:MAG: hypothetical protein QNJ94_19480 [Alphaproteobacteria bacterium]|nr:hypothetical protein [Alphaproteobacteria bacterium]
MAGYQTFEVPDVADQTGQNVSPALMGVVTDRLKSGLREAGYQVTPPGAGTDPVLLVESRLIAYEPGTVAERWTSVGGGTAYCMVQSDLVDRTSGEIKGEIVSRQRMRGGGLASGGYPRQVLENCADGIVAGIKKELKP